MQSGLIFVGLDFLPYVTYIHMFLSFVCSHSIGLYIRTVINLRPSIIRLLCSYAWTLNIRKLVASVELMNEWLRYWCLAIDGMRYFFECWRDLKETRLVLAWYTRCCYCTVDSAKQNSLSLLFLISSSSSSLATHTYNTFGRHLSSELVWIALLVPIVYITWRNHDTVASMQFFKIRLVTFKKQFTNAGCEKSMKPLNDPDNSKP